MCFRFLVDAAEIILENIDNEGVFRKSGAVSRQKEIKVLNRFIFVWLLILLKFLYHFNDYFHIWQVRMLYQNRGQ
jgi:hypothetical protein